ncbi:hypothetical protein V6N11_015761 [Hibiscus sabdariffa]|uniref:Uncharacterized protein n=1 Tax=Hibiscus sabdariffa TaxID=183260 RepID=A0ABR2TT33_9ROSI
MMLGFVVGETRICSANLSVEEISYGVTRVDQNEGIIEVAQTGMIIVSMLASTVGSKAGGYHCDKGISLIMDPENGAVSLLPIIFLGKEIAMISTIQCQSKLLS